MESSAARAGATVGTVMRLKRNKKQLFLPNSSMEIDISKAVDVIWQEIMKTAEYSAKVKKEEKARSMQIAGEYH